MKKGLIFISVMLCLFLYGCVTTTETQEGSGTVYKAFGDSVSVCSVTVDGDWKIAKAELNSYLSVYDMGSEYDDGEKTDGFSKYVRVGDVIFENRDGVYYVEDVAFSEFVSNDENAKWYVEKVSEGDFDVSDGQKDLGLSFDRYDDASVKKKEWANKLKNGYHMGKEYEFGWAENVYAMIKHLRNHGFYGYTGEEIKEKTYVVGGYDTGVEFEEFHDYMNLAKSAYEEAKRNIK